MKQQKACGTCDWERAGDEDWTFTVCGNPSSKFCGMVTSENSIYCEEWREMVYYGFPEGPTERRELEELSEEELREYKEYFKSIGIELNVKEKEEANNDL